MPTTGDYAGGVTAIAGGIIGAEGAMDSGRDSYEAGQVQYHQELERGHYEAKILQRQMLEELHMQFAKGGAAGIQIGEGSPMLVAMHTLNNLQEDKAQIYRNASKTAWQFWKTGADKFEAAQNQATGSLLSGIGKAATMLL